MSLIERLIETAGQLKKIDESIERLMPLLDYAGIFKISIAGFGINGNWEGHSDTVCEAISEQVEKDLQDLRDQKSAMLLDLSNDIIDVVREEAPTEGPID